ncbi:hypothetical protein GCM10028787_31350 [Brachybacterium horti]
MSEVVAPDEGEPDVWVADKDQARELVDEIKERGARLVERAAELERDKEDFGSLVGSAYRHRVWVALGYASWHELVQTEFSGARFFDSITARRARVEALIVEGLSTRAIGDVLGISHSTVYRDGLATVSDETVTRVAAPSGPSKIEAASSAPLVDLAPSPKMQGLDGKERQRKRATPAEMADRALLVAQRRAEGWTQEEIADSIGVTQKTISNDDRMVQGWKTELSASEVKRLEKGQLTRAELAESANLEIVERDRKRLETGARNGARALAEGLKFLSESVVYADAWLEERTETSAILAPSLANVAGEGTEWMALEFDYESVPDEAMQLLHDDLGRAAEWAHQAQLRLVSAAEAHGVDLDRESYREDLTRKVEARQGRQR